MSKAGKGKKTFVILYLTAIHLLLALFVYDKFLPQNITEQNKINQVVALATPVQIPFEPNNFPQNKESANQTPISSSEGFADANKTGNNPINTVPASSEKIMIPVVGVKKEKLTDTFSDARSENRVHNAIDIIAPQGTPVIAVADGEIARFFDSELGGITIYQFSKDRKFIYYYAHLQKRAENLQDKSFISQGTVIGYVGDTGNAGAGNFHLHFSISVPSDPKKYWEGENINPFPLLKDGIEAQAR